MYESATMNFLYNTKNFIKANMRFLGILTGIVLIIGSLGYMFWYNLNVSVSKSDKSSNKSASRSILADDPLSISKVTKPDMSAFSSSLKGKNDAKYILLLVTILGIIILINAVVKKKRE